MRAIPIATTSEELRGVGEGAATLEMQQLLVEEVQRSLHAKEAALDQSRVLSHRLAAHCVVAVLSPWSAWSRPWALARALASWSRATCIIESAAAVSSLRQQVRAVGALAETRGAKSRAVADMELEARRATVAHEGEIQELRREAAAASRRELAERCRREAMETKHKRTVQLNAATSRDSAGRAHASVALALAVHIPEVRAALLGVSCAFSHWRSFSQSVSLLERWGDALQPRIQRQAILDERSGQTKLIWSQTRAALTRL